ncbi:MAG: hypothetical protein AAF607_10155 [Pseudomonadota bacterium]
MTKGYKHGDHWVYCDRSGYKVRASETIVEWTGLRVWKRFADHQQHPQDFLRGKKDNTSVPNPRAEPPPVFVDSNEVQPSDL